MLGQDSFLAIAKLRLAPALAGLRLGLFRFDQSNHPPTLLPTGIVVSSQQLQQPKLTVQAQWSIILSLSII